MIYNLSLLPGIWKGDEGIKKYEGKSMNKEGINKKLLSILMTVIMVSSLFAGVIPVVATSNSTENTTAPINGTADEENSLTSIPPPDNRNDYSGISVASSIPTTTVAPLAVEWGQCGPIDLVIVLDDTGSMGGAIDNIKAELPNIITTANTASGGDLRMGYITFKDNVTVHNNLTINISAVTDSINATVADSGAGGPEA